MERWRKLHKSVNTYSKNKLFFIIFQVNSCNPSIGTYCKHRVSLIIFELITKRCHNVLQPQPHKSLLRKNSIHIFQKNWYFNYRKSELNPHMVFFFNSLYSYEGLFHKTAEKSRAIFIWRARYNMTLHLEHKIFMFQKY